MKRLGLLLTVATVALAMLVSGSGTAMAQSVPFDPTDCEYIEGQSFCEGVVVDLIGGTTPVTFPVCYVIDDFGTVLAVNLGDCPASG